MQENEFENILYKYWSFVSASTCYIASGVMLYKQTSCG